VREAVCVLGEHGYAADIDVGGKHYKIRWLGRDGRHHLLVLSRSPSSQHTPIHSRAVLARMLRAGEKERNPSDE
jgi:hypothetical protein